MLQQRQQLLSQIGLWTDISILHIDRTAREMFKRTEDAEYFLQMFNGRDATAAALARLEGNEVPQEAINTRLEYLDDMFKNNQKAMQTLVDKGMADLIYPGLLGPMLFHTGLVPYVSLPKDVQEQEAMALFVECFTDQGMTFQSLA